MVLIAIPVVGLTLAAACISCIPFVAWIPALGKPLAGVLAALAG